MTRCYYSDEECTQKNTDSSPEDDHGEDQLPVVDQKLPDMDNVNSM